jgi:hypothetical protein
MTRLLLILLSLFALVAGGCGSDDGGGGEEDDPLAALDAAAKKTKAAESNRQEFTMESDIGGAELSMEGEGTFSADSTRGHMTFDMETPQGDGSFEAIVVDGVMYIKGDQIQLPGGKEWLKQQDPPSNTMSPSEFVTFLRDSGNVENKGTEEIRGEETTHFAGPLDLQKLAEESGSDIVEQLKSTPGAEDMEMNIDIWVGPDGLPARMILDVSAPEQAEGSMKVTSDILEYNVDVEAEAPPASEVATG